MSDGEKDSKRSVVVSVFMDEDLRENLREMAEADNRSLSQMAATILKDAVEKAKEIGKFPKRAD
jgi:predicted transcriptional regulator